ncbi:hypothetical protein J6590_075090 [Homalodisca vitripennis]|nr:hypothetical protein J6590_075090 [Homalodisca vitripennis]
MIDEHNTLTSEIAFVATALFNIMRTAMSIIPLTVQVLLQLGCFCLGKKHLIAIPTSLELNTQVSNAFKNTQVSNAFNASWLSGQSEPCLLKRVGTPPGHNPKDNVQGGEVETAV